MDTSKEDLCFSNQFRNVDGGRSWCLVWTGSSDVNVWQSKVILIRYLLQSLIVIKKMRLNNTIIIQEICSKSIFYPPNDIRY